MNEQVKNIQAEISNAEAIIKAAKDKKYQAEKAAEKEYWNTVSPLKIKLKALVDEYEDLAIEIAEEQKVPPYSRSGSYLNPTEIEATEKGIHLTWDADEHYNCVYHTVTWEEIFEAQNKQNN